MGISKTLHPAFFLGICGRKILEYFNRCIKSVSLKPQGLRQVSQSQLKSMFRVLFFIKRNVLLMLYLNY